MSSPLSEFFLSVATSMIFLSLSRLLFWQTYGSGLLPSSAWLAGLRFDAAIGVYVASPLIFSLLWAPLTKVSRVLSSVFAIAIILLVVADYLYYPSAAKRLGHEAWVYLNPDLIPIALTAVRATPLAFVGALVSVFLASLYLIKFVKRPVPKWSKLNLLWFFVVLVAAVFLARGGAQRVPLRLGDSIVSSSPLINNAVLNAPYSVLASALIPSSPRYMDAAEARRLSLEMLALPPKSDEVKLPLMQTFPQRESNKYNVVLILLESFTGSLTRAGGGTSQATPEFDRLTKDGLVFPKFVASGFRTTSGLFSSLTGMPDSLGVPMMRRPELNNSFSSLSRLLKEQGYKNYFVHGGQLDFDNLDRMLKLEDFDRVEGKDQLQYTGGFHRTWGYADEYAYNHALQMVSETEDPFFMFLLTVSSHAPYEVPPHRLLRHPQPDAINEGRYLNAVAYADQALGEFIEGFRALPQFKNTVFVITGDHTHHGPQLDPWTNQHVPLLIYSPGIIRSGISDAPGSHTDILPTIADLLQLPWVAAFGRSLISNPEGPVYFISGLQLGLWDGKLLSFNTLSKSPSNHYFVEDQKAQPTVVDPLKDALIRKKTLSMYQFSSDLIQNNQVAPSRDSN